MDARTIHVGAQPTPYDGGPRTRVFVLLGHPVQHSLSPVFQNAALRALGLDAVYVAVDVPSDELGAAVARLRDATRAGQLGGVNVTVPHKTAILEHLDALDDTARAVGAVNTVCVTTRGGQAWLQGRNTDVEGVQRALGDAGISMRDAAVVVVGAGGAARAAAWAALQARAATLGVVNRTPENARDLLETLLVRAPDRRPATYAGGFDLLSAERLREARVLVQTTSLGMRAADPSPVALDDASHELFVLEMIYARESALLHQARTLGLRCADGRDMLVHQGAASLRAWTHHEPPVELMKRSLTSH